MARQSERLNSYTGYFGTYKGIVTRPYTDDPLGLGRLQVWIPFYHGGSNYDSSKIGYGDDPGEYPWAQVSSIRFGAGSTSTGTGFNFWGSLLNLFGGGSPSTSEYNGGSTYAQDVKLADIVYPNVGDPVWLQFENGDIRYPIYVGSLVNGNETISGSPAVDIAKITKDMIVANKSNSKYNYVNWIDETGNDGIGVGLLQWHNGKAKELFDELKGIDTDGYNTVCKDNNCTDFDTILNNRLRWNPAKFEKNSVQGRTIQALLNIDNSKTAQENIITKDVQRCINTIKGKGYVDVGAIMICADYYNMNSSMPNIKVNPSSVTTQEFLNSLLNINNLQRWKYDYDYIMGLVSQGVLVMNSNGQLTIPILAGENNQELFIFPVPDCNKVSRNFSKGTNNIQSIDISDGTPKTYGLDVVASHDGTAKFGYDANRGNYVEIEYHAPTVTSSSVANIALQEWNNGNNPYYQPRNGKTKYSSSGAWCAYFATWCCVQAGIMKSQIGAVRSVEDYFRKKGLFGTYPSYKPVVGDLLTMRHSGGNHIGVVVAVNGDTIEICDGNSRGSAPKSANKSHIERTQFSWSGGTSKGGYYRTVGYCKTGNSASGGAANQYSSVITGYYHLNTKVLSSGTKEVKAGDKIGTIGQTGKCSGPLLEFSMKTNGSYIDPMSKMSTTSSLYNGQKGNLIGNYRVTAYYPDNSAMEGGFFDMKGRRLNPSTYDTVAVTKSLLQSNGGPLKYGDKIIIDGISKYVSGKNSDVCIVRDTGGGLKGIDFLVANRSAARAWNNPNLNVYFCK